MNFLFKTKIGSVKLNHNVFLVTGILTFLLIVASSFSAESSSSSVEMNATVSNVVSVNTSTALTRGVLFGSLSVNTNNNMAENDTTGTGNVTEYYLGNGPTSTGTLSFYHNASDLNRGGNPDVILIVNVTHEANTTNPDADSNVNMSNIGDGTMSVTTTLSGIGIGNCTSVVEGSVCWLAYWLDVPASVPDGTYNTSYTYCGNMTNGNTEC